MTIHQKKYVILHEFTNHIHVSIQNNSYTLNNSGKKVLKMYSKYWGKIITLDMS